MKNNSILNGKGRTGSIAFLPLTLGYMGLIYWLSSLPGSVDEGEDMLSGLIAWTPPALQNLLHIPMFGLLAWLWHQTLQPWISSRSLLYSSVFLLAVGYGIGDELHQMHVPGRYASLTDIALNTAGVAAAIWILRRRTL